MRNELIKRNEIKELRDLFKQGLEAERLILLPLDLHDLELAVSDYGKLQSDLGLKVENIILDEEMQYAMKVRLKKVLEDIGNYLWLTNWAIIHKEAKQLIGFIMLKGLPNEEGEVIVGYGVEDKFRRKGYATETLRRLIEWIFENPKALSVIADTEKTNIPSHKVLQNVGASIYKETEDLLWWKVSREELL